MDWGNVLVGFFMIFELGPDSESLCNADPVPPESIRCEIKAFLAFSHMFFVSTDSNKL